MQHIIWIMYNLIEYVLIGLQAEVKRLGNSGTETSLGASAKILRLSHGPGLQQSSTMWERHI